MAAGMSRDSGALDAGAIEPRLRIVSMNDGFAGEVSGVDITRPVSNETIAAIDAGMDEYGAFLRDLTEHATQRKFVYSHSWRRNDLTMWDNRVTMHRVTRFDETRVRDMRRTTVAGISD
ncbi:MAG: hypothetical protein EXR07_12545 [Acetobacteraceae bacterium]|nr:hypothetical protein [Acetobacteraceae bacterium]